MKVKTLYWFVLSLSLFISSCSRAEESAADTITSPQNQGDLLQGKKVLIVYLSRTKNTKTLAEIIHRKISGDLVPLELETPYPEHYQTTVDQVAQENRTGYLPPLKTKIDGMETYDMVFIGFPTWGMQLPPPVKSFLMQHNLAGKTVIPFNTNAAYGIGSSFETLSQLCPKSKILEGYTTKGGVERDGIFFVMEGEKEKRVEKEVQQWLTNIALLK
ncbi:flavodoxin [Sphingobacterium faecium]|uniref:flavodoxin family protein n=1 Tax=Sphingobacterium faecium TaxID=34087 RepID=UPI00320ABDBF